jgi:hypothetical protein
MTEEQACRWLGLPWPLPDGKRLRPEIAAGLAEVPAPGEAEGDDTSPDGGHVRVFAAFLKCQVRPPVLAAKEDPCG